MAASLITAAIGAGASLYAGRQQAKAARDAAAQQSAGIERGVAESEPYYQQSLDYLSPYITSGTQNNNLLNDVIGHNGTEAQTRARGMYDANPSAGIMKDVADDTARRTIGTFSANGGANSGAAVEELGRRLSDVRLSDYNNWLNLSKGMSDSRAGARGQPRRHGTDQPRC